MKIGITVCGSAQSWRRARRAEELGFHSVRFWDSPLVAGDVFVNAATAAAHTERINIGTGVYVPWTRDPAVTACAFASLNAMAPGRIELTAGTGRTARRSYGLKSQSLAEFGEHMRAVIALLSGQEASVELHRATTSLRFLHPQIAVDIADPVAITIAAAGPKIQALTAELGVGWADILPPSSQGVPPSLQAMQAAWERSGRSAVDLRATYFVPNGGRLHDGEAADSERIRQIAGPWAMSEVHYWVDEVYIQGKNLPEFVSGGIRTAVEAYEPLLDALRATANPVLSLQEGHGLFVRPEELHLLNEDLLRAGSLIWTPDELREKVATLERAGVQEMCFSVRHDTDEDIEDLAGALQLG